MHSIDAYPEKACPVFVNQTGKTVWVASGSFRGEPLIVKGQSERAAADQWKELAEWRYRTS
ncbi:hypothetical protein J2Y58_000998 [Sphingomonas sp. BE138]|nr:hypothetical protein [Sphingomonas sp. BE138]